MSFRQALVRAIQRNTQYLETLKRALVRDDTIQSLEEISVGFAVLQFMQENVGCIDVPFQPDKSKRMEQIKEWTTKIEEDCAVLRYLDNRDALDKISDFTPFVFA